MFVVAKTFVLLLFGALCKSGIGIEHNIQGVP